MRSQASYPGKEGLLMLNGLLQQPLMHMPEVMCKVGLLLSDWL